MGRAALAAAFIGACLLSGNAAAQVSLGAGRMSGVTVTRAPEPSPITAPPRPAPAGGLQGGPSRAPFGDPDLFRAGPHTYRPRPFKLHHLPFWPYTVVTPGYFPFHPVPFAEALPSYAPVEVPGGYLRLQVQPGSAQVFVDGNFIGTVQETGNRLLLEAGSHRVEVVAEGFDTLTFDVRIRPHETITYRRDLQRTDARAVTPVAPVAVTARAVAKTLYVIPRCYAGDKRPVAAELPEGCRIADVRVLPVPVAR